MIAQVVSNNKQGSTDVKLKGNFAVRRLFFFTSSSVGLRYKGNLIANTNTFHIDFLSYYGYPKFLCASLS